MGTEGLYDRFHCTEFYPPGYLLLHSGITGQGRPREEGYLIKVLNGITPIDATTSWYYYAFSRNFAVDNDAATEELREGLATVLQEDADALALQEIGMQGRPPSQRDVLIAQDVQVGIADFSNSREYASRARDLGITVVTRDALRRRPIADVMAEALAIAGGGGGPIDVDLDVDVCDRSVVPGCPAAAPGGLTADELRQAAFHAGRSPRVHSLDITEIDAAADSADGRTVRLGALLVLEAACGLALR